MEHRLELASGVGGEDALLGPEGAGHGVSFTGSLVGRELGEKPEGFSDWHDSPFITVPRSSGFGRRRGNW